MLIVTGTDTDVGKTVFAAMLTLALDGVYWKPVQAGTADVTDTQRVQALTGLDASHVRPEAYVLGQPLSPHRAAELDGLTLDIERIATLPAVEDGRSLIVEGAGGVMVPLTRDTLFIDMFVRWRAPVVICARTRLGTINHTLLTVEALRRRALPIAGIAFIGDHVPDTERTIVDIAKVPALGRLPHLPTLNRDTLLEAFHAHFRRADFTVAAA
jgi:dethiobiotin synthase